MIEEGGEKAFQAVYRAHKMHRVVKVSNTVRQL